MKISAVYVHHDHRFAISGRVRDFWELFPPETLDKIMSVEGKVHLSSYWPIREPGVVVDDQAVHTDYLTLIARTYFSR